MAATPSTKTKLHIDTLSNLIEALNNVSDFTLASPLNDNKNFPNLTPIFLIYLVIINVYL